MVVLGDELSEMDGTFIQALERAYGA